MSKTDPTKLLAKNKKTETNSSNKLPKASKKTTAQLQKLIDFLGEKGGAIHTKTPNSWWNLNLQVERIDEISRYASLGIHNNINGDELYDPEYRIFFEIEDKKITEVYILSRVSETVLGVFCTDSDGMMYYSGGFGILAEKDTTSLSEHFSIFMNDIVEYGPYLKEPESVNKYGYYWGEE